MLRLLLIEDNPDDRTLIVYELRREFPDVQVEEVLEAQGFNCALNKGNFDLAITDCRLGWNNGLTVFHELKSRYPNCPVIMFSGSGSEEIAVEAMKSGLEDYITKSARNYARLPVAVQSALRRSQDKIKLKQAEAALRQSEERLRLLVESAKDYAIITMDSDGYVTSWNPEAERILGYSEAEIIGRSGSCIFTPEDIKYGVPEQELGAAVANGRVEDDRWHVRKDGTRFWASGIVVPLRDDAGNLLGFSKILRDITERQQAEAESRRLNIKLEGKVRQRTVQLQQALKFEVLLKAIADKVRESLDERQILQTAVRELTLGLGINGCDTALYDLEAEISTITYEYIYSELPPALGQVADMAAQPELYAQLMQGNYAHFSWRLPFADPIRLSKQRFTILACPIIDDQCVLGDVWLFRPEEDHFTEPEIRLVQQVASQCAIALRQARLYQAATAQVEELEKLNRLKDDFLNTVSHELRTPMTSIKIALQMLETTLQQAGILDVKPPRIEQYLQILRDECQREINLINDLLDLARLDADGTSTLTKIRLQNWLDQLIDAFAERARSQQQSLKIDIPTDLPEVITGSSELERILTELLHNAFKYTPAGETILVVATATFDRLRLQVSNSGVEIPASEIPRIFEKFYRIPNNDPWKYGGTGLGLALVKKLVEYLGGTIQATANQGWTTFTVELPWTPSCPISGKISLP